MFYLGYLSIQLTLHLSCLFIYIFIFIIYLSIYLWTIYLSVLTLLSSYLWFLWDICLFLLFWYDNLCFYLRYHLYLYFRKSEECCFYLQHLSILDYIRIYLSMFLILQSVLKSVCCILHVWPWDSIFWKNW